jgi:hypothetical protein
MEDISGNFMRSQLAPVPTEGDPALALWFARFAKACVFGLAGIDWPVLGRLAQRQTVSHSQRSGIEGVLVALDALLASPTYEELAAAAAVIRQIQGRKVYRWEAWNDTREAIAMSADNGEPAVDNLGRLRDRLRRTGRRNDNRIASRTPLVKGLEYDHVSIADLSKLRDPCTCTSRCRGLGKR